MVVSDGFNSVNIVKFVNIVIIFWGPKIFLDPRIVCDPRVFWYPRALSNVPKASKVATFSTLYYEDVTFQLNLNYLSTFILLAHSDKRSLCHDALLIFFEHVSMKLFASFTTEIGFCWCDLFRRTLWSVWKGLLPVWSIGVSIRLFNVVEFDLSEKKYFLLQCDRCYNGRDKTWRLKTHLFPSSLGGDQPIEKVQVDLLPEDAWDVLETGPGNIVLNILFM